MSDEALDRDLGASEQYLEEWIRDVGKLVDAIPVAHRNLEYIRLERRAVANLPAEASTIEFPFAHDYYLRRHRYLTDTFLPLPRIDMDLVASSTAVLTSGTASYVPFFERVAALGTPETCLYGSEQLRYVEEWQGKEQSAEEVRFLLGRFRSEEILDRFDKSKHGYELFVAGAGAREAAANTMRILVDGFQGELFAKARRWPKENMTWPEMADRLARRTPGGLTHDVLVGQGEHRKTLYHELSDAAKKYEGGVQHDLGLLWRRVLDHIYTCLGSASI